MNEPAFPMFKPRIENYCEEEVIPGMSLRDYFAAKAMQTTLAVGKPCKSHDITKYMDGVAAGAYLMADAVLKSRTEPKGE